MDYETRKQIHDFLNYEGRGRCLTLSKETLTPSFIDWLVYGSDYNDGFSPLCKRRDYAVDYLKSRLTKEHIDYIRRREPHLRCALCDHPSNPYIYDFTKGCDPETCFQISFKMEK
jgi:hypothetical protein